MDSTTTLIDENGTVVRPMPATPRKRPTTRAGRNPTPKEAPDTWPTARTIRLNSLGEVANELARVYRGMARGRLDPAAGTKLCYVLSALAKVTESAQFEARISKLEAAQQQPLLTLDSDNEPGDEDEPDATP